MIKRREYGCYYTGTRGNHAVYIVEAYSKNQAERMFYLNYPYYNGSLRIVVVDSSTPMTVKEVRYRW